MGSGGCDKGGESQLDGQTVRPPVRGRVGAGPMDSQTEGQTVTGGEDRQIAELGG